MVSVRQREVGKTSQGIQKEEEKEEGLNLS